MILIVFGILFILRNLDIVWFGWRDIWQFWPVFLIIWGISLLPLKALYRLLLSLAAIVLGIILVHQYGSHEPLIRWKNNGAAIQFYNHRDDDNEEEVSAYEQREGSKSIPMDETVTHAELNLEVGAGSFDLVGTSDKLMVCDFSMEDLYTLDSKTSNDRATLNLKMKEIDWKKQHHNNEVVMRLNQTPEWSLDFEVGAADLNMDLRPFDVREITLDGGASSLEFTLGERAEKLQMEIDAGAAAITLHIPKESGCEVTSESFLIDKSMEGFTKLSKGHYRTENFDTAPHKIFIDLEAAIISFHIDRY
ncbi:MAG: hypothetical protein CSA95_03705 [Bacteroidetes bacterium]|nr:MAG: hypothetical protein CSA95_03705 [Bacteroidota bacterium]